MTLTEAIEIVEADKNQPFTQKFPELVEAEKLLIKAGERELEVRQNLSTSEIALLPGETKD